MAVFERKKTDLSPSSASNGTQEKTRMEKPRIHTTRYGTQYVDVIDIIQSDAGWAEIQRIKEANLVPSPENGTIGSSPPDDNKMG